MKIRNRMCEENPAGRRILCRVLLLMVTGIFLLYVLGGARFFSALRPSECEKLLRDGQQVQAYGRVYKKEIKVDTYVLYMENVRVRGDNISQSTKIVCEEQMVVYLSEDKVKSLAQIDDAVPKIGQTIMVCGTISFFQDAPNPGNFNQRFYYQKQNIHAAIQKAEILSNITVSEERERNRKWSLNLREFLWQFRGGIAEIIRENMDEKHSGILCAMLLGENAYVDEELKEIYQKSGIGHLLAISGLHVSFVGMGLYQILRKMGVHVSVAAVAGSIFLCFYVVMSGESVSAVRACVMFLMRMGAVVTGREYDGLTALSAAALVVLGKNPLRLFDAGFLLSFGAILGLSLIHI